MIRPWLFLFCLALCGSGCGATPSPPEPGTTEGALARTLHSLDDGWPRDVPVAVGNFVHAEHGSGSPFGCALQAEVARLLAAEGRPLLDRRRLEVQLAANGTSLERYLGRSRGVGGVRPLKEGPTVEVWGDYRVDGDDVAVRLRCSDGAEAQVRLPLSAVREQGALLPANHVASEGARSGLGDDQQDFGLEVWVDRGAGGGYAVGDALQVFVRAERDCYVKLLHVASDGTMRVVFPNGFDTNNRLAAGAVHRIGGVDDPFRLRVSEPTGEESIFAYASTAQFADVDALLAQARRTGAAAQGAADAAGIREFRARGLKIEARDAAPLRAAASTRYVVLGPAGE